MDRTWEGEAELRIYATNIRMLVYIRATSNPARIPGLTYPTWSGKFQAEPFTPFTVGRGVITLPDGTEADVLVESFDSLNGEGYFMGAGCVPF